MANRLSNEELRKALQKYGEDVGPITPTTRSTWERRLMALRKSKNPSLPNSHAFSSDDSEIENNASNTMKKKRTHSRSSFGERSDSLPRRPTELYSPPDSDIFKKPVAIPISPLENRTHRTPNSGNRKVKKKNSAFDVETSDSDFDSDSSLPKSTRPRRKPLTSNFPVEFQGEKDFNKFNLKSANNSLNHSSPFQRKFPSTSWTPKSDQSFLHLTPMLDRFKNERNTSYQSNGYPSSAMSNGDFPEEKLAQGSSTVTNYSHCVSWILLIGAVMFFVVIGVVYMSEVQKTNQSTDKSNYEAFCKSMNEEQCKSVISMCRELHYVLTRVAGDFECGSSKSRNLTVSEAISVMQEYFSGDYFVAHNFSYAFKHSVSLFMKNPELGVICHPNPDMSSAQSLATNHEISALEATQAAKSFWCRVQLSFAWTLTKFLLLCFVGILLFFFYLLLKFMRSRKEAHEKMFYEMVENVIDILQDSSNSLQQNDALPGSCKVVVNVRDALIPVKDRKKKLWLWDRVVSFIEENESRVSVEFRKINGEDFKVWRWNPCSTSEGEGGKHGKVWQGQAFSSLGKGKNAHYTPSSCLKIRNMFDPEVEYGNDWQVSVSDAILEKCEGNDGIRHIAFDTSTNNEGCVYMMCNSSEAAGQAYNDLHGWWFDGKLVTVKYLKVSRYLEHFPEAENCSEPLKPSNNKRLSLSTPFFSSALERS